MSPLHHGRSASLLVLLVAMAAPPFAHRLAAQDVATRATTAPRVVGPNGGERRPRPDGRVQTLKVGPMNGGSSYLFLGSEELPPGTSVRKHLHEVDEEILIVHRGRLRVTLNDSTYLAETGTVVFLPPGTWISATNPGPETVTMMYVFPRAAVEKCFQAPASGPRSPAELAEVQPICHMRYADEARH